MALLKEREMVFKAFEIGIIFVNVVWIFKKTTKESDQVNQFFYSMSYRNIY